MSPLRSLQNQLNRLRWYRWGVSVGAAVCSLLIALCWGLLFLLAADILFQLPISQRVTAMVLIGIVAIWFVWRRVAAGLRLPEDTEDVALLVERNHNLDTDLIAAMQFHANPHDPALGSPALRQAVILRAADLTDQLNFFDGISARPLPTRIALLTVTLAGAVTLGVLFPGHASVFWRRLQLGRDHYPTQTTIQSISVNGQTVLKPEDPTLTPLARKCAEGITIELLVAARRAAPSEGTVNIRSGGQEAELPLTALSLRDRINRLQRAREMLEDPGASLLRVVSLCRADCPTAADALSEHGLAQLDGARRHLDSQLAQGEDGLDQKTQWYLAELPRHGRTLRYDIQLGDAWTEEGEITMIPLPTVALHAVAVSPEYSKLGRIAMSPGARQLRVLEGSAVALSIECLNNKELQSAWATLVRDAEPPMTIPLEQDGDVWRVPTTGTPLEEVRERIQFTVQVKDTDGLQLPQPVAGQIHVRPDRPPTGAATVLHRVVLPEAKPKLSIRADDDFGIQKLQLRILVERPQDAIQTTAPGVSQTANDDAPSAGVGDPSDSTTNEVIITIDTYREVNPSAAGLPAKEVNPSAAGLPAKEVNPSAAGLPAKEVNPSAAGLPAKEVNPSAAGSPLPLELDYSLGLAPLKLAKGDRVKITLEIVDERGSAPGAAYQANPLVLEVSDEAGVLAAVSESDEHSERKLNELIQQQLGIGDSP